MYKHILVAVDDSQTSRKALDEAIALALLHNAKLDIAHAVDESLLQAFNRHGAVLAHTEELEQALLDSGESLLAESVGKARDSGIEATHRLLASPDQHAADQIAHAVEVSGADLLVMGSHGRRGMRRLLLGSVAENVLRKVSISVLIVRAH